MTFHDEIWDNNIPQEEKNIDFPLFPLFYLIFFQVASQQETSNSKVTVFYFMSFYSTTKMRWNRGKGENQFCSFSEGYFEKVPKRLKSSDFFEFIKWHQMNFCGLLKISGIYTLFCPHSSI